MKKEIIEKILKEIPTDYLDWKQRSGVYAGSMMAQAEVDTLLSEIINKIKKIL